MPPRRFLYSYAAGVGLHRTERNTLRQKNDKRLLIMLACLTCLPLLGFADTVSPLFARGYTVIPEPQQVSLGDGDFTFDSSWRLQIDKSVASGDVAVEALRSDLASRFNLTLSSTGTAHTLSLQISPGSVHVGTALDRDKNKLADQAYRIDFTS